MLERSRLQVADATGETLLELSDINADAALESLTSPLTLTARAVWQGTPLRFEGQVASLERFLRSQAVAVDGTLGFADATASLFGDLDLSTGEPAFLGWRVNASGPDLSDVLTRIGVVLPVAPRLLPAFEARLSFDLDAGLLSAPQIVAQVGRDAAERTGAGHHLALGPGHVRKPRTDELQRPQPQPLADRDAGRATAGTALRPGTVRGHAAADRIQRLAGRPTACSACARGIRPRR